MRSVKSVLMKMQKHSSKEGQSSNTSTTVAVDIDGDKEKEYARLCREILAATSFANFEKLSKEAAAKDMFLPLPQAKSNDNSSPENSIKHRHENMFLGIVTLKLSAGELKNPTCHRRGALDGVFYLLLCPVFHHMCVVCG